MEQPILSTQAPPTGSSNFLLIAFAIFLLTIGVCLFKKMRKISSVKSANNNQVVFEESEYVSLQELEVVFYGSMNCPYCRQTKDLLEDDGSWDSVQYIDTSTPEGNVAFTQAVGEGKKGIPYFISEITNETFTGFPGSVEHLTNVLNKKPKVEKFTKTKKIEKFTVDSSVQYEWFGTPRCPWCNKTKELFKQMDISNRFNDTSTPEGKTRAQEYGLTGGVPFIINTSTGNTHRGFPGSMEKLEASTK